MLLPDPIDDGNKGDGDGDGEKRGAAPDPLITPEGACCPWCFALDDSPARTEGIHTCHWCGKEYTTGVMLTHLWINSPKGGNDAWRWN